MENIFRILEEELIKRKKKEESKKEKATVYFVFELTQHDFHPF